MPIEVGCVLVRSEEAHRRAFSLTPEYLSHFERGVAGGSHWFNEYGPQLTRGFRALKVWLSLKEHGVAKYGRLIKQNVDQCQYLTELIQAAPELELLAPTSLNIVCFRFKAAGLNDEALNQLNRNIMFELTRARHCRADVHHAQRQVRDPGGARQPSHPPGGF